MGIFQAILALFIIPQSFGSSNEAHLLLDLGATLSFIALIIAGWRILPRSYSIWMVVFMIFILLSPATGKPDILLSNQRFVLEMFPGIHYLGTTLQALRQMAPHAALSLSSVADCTQYRFYYELLDCLIFALVFCDYQSSSLLSKGRIFMKRAPLWDVGWLFIVTRILLVIVTYFGYILLTQEKYWAHRYLLQPL